MTILANELVGTCFICKRRHDNLGYSPDERRSPIKWLCLECLDDTHNGVRSKLPKVYHMPKRQLDDYERRALEDGGNAGGSYLDELGKTDLAELEPDEWAAFLSRVLTGYADSMREMVSREVPF
jgi:hypothetical protein